jgi:hypothetical protein
MVTFKCGKEQTKRISRKGAKKKRLKENSEQKAVSREKMSMRAGWKGEKLCGFAALAKRA